MTQKEITSIVERLSKTLTGKTLKDMYASSDRKVYARKLLLPLFRTVEKERKPVRIPSAKLWQRSMELVLEQLNQEPQLGV